jgi:DnaK suppressor protein
MNRKLTVKQIEEFKNLFIKQKEDSIAFCKKNVAVPEIDIDGDEIDVIQASLLHAVDAKIIERELQKITKIDLALLKIERNLFGNCEECGDLIGKKRLEARPEAEFCIICQEKAEADAKLFNIKNS